MTDRVLKAQMQLFAIVARLENHVNQTIEQEKLEEYILVIQNFIESEISHAQIEQYLQSFEEHYHLLGKRKKFSVIEQESDIKRSSLNSVKALRICEELNRELTYRQKFFAFIRICELIALQDNPLATTIDFLRTLSESFNLDKEDTALIQNLILNPLNEAELSSNVLIGTSSKKERPNYLHILGMNGKIVIGYLHSINTIFVRYLGEDVFIINGNTYDARKTFLLQSGSFIQCGPSEKIYQSDLLNRFLRQNNVERFVFEAKNISYKTSKGDKTLIQPFSSSFKAGRLVGIMGLSGSGKTTLIELLNGTIKPTSGQVTINGVDVHEQFDQLEGIIGYVPQNDQLIDQLTVYENLYFTAKLCFANATSGEIKLKVHRLLKTFGLYEIKDLKVGNSIDKIISGGQRKRLNIALELIQNPDILFIDEPTSGLSSKGSLDIMNHLKELTFSGKLVFVVIHQPSSDIFKLFNRIIILDNGGHLTFDGKPIDALDYFKDVADVVGKHVEECPTCHNVEPHMLFEIIDSRVLLETGTPSIERKVQPEEWSERFSTEGKFKSKFKGSNVENLKPLSPKINKPSAFRQFLTFFYRDGLSKLNNKQFMIIMLLQAPILGFLLSTFLKEYAGTISQPYDYYYNSNIPSFLFICVLVAIFFGTTMSAEEIFKDAKTLKRQRYLHLSWNSYLLSKVAVLILITGIQSLLYSLVSASIIGLMHSFWSYWFVLFSLAIWANMLGLTISTLFKSTKVIYITVPVIIIPQIIFSGILVKFDRMHPLIRAEYEVPWIGNLMASRWSYEALAVDLATKNPLENIIYQAKQKKNEANWKTEFWIPQMQILVQEATQDQTVKNELVKENKFWNKDKCLDCVVNDTIDRNRTIKQLQKWKVTYNATYQYWNTIYENKLIEYGEEKFNRDNVKYNNEELSRLVTNRYQLEKIAVDSVNKRIVQLANPVYQAFDGKVLDAPLYVKSKSLFGFQIDTYWVNNLIIWIFSLFFYLSLAMQLTVSAGKNLQSYFKNRQMQLIKKRIERRTNKRG